MSIRSSRVRPELETLEDRAVPSVTSATLYNRMIYINGDNNASNVSLTQSGTNILVKDATNGFQKSFATSGVDRAQFVGGSGNDRVVNYVPTLPLQAWGYGGNDYLEGYNGADILVGGTGHDSLKAYGGNDSLWGEDGDDWLWGDDGNDSLYGQNDNDHLFGGNDRDYVSGGAGADDFDGGGGFDNYRDDFNLDQWVQNGFSRFDIIQGEAGTCVINAAMAEAAEQVNLSGDIVRSGNWYQVRLIDNGQFSYQWVYFDGSWNDNDTRPGQTRSSDGTPTGVNNGEFWTLLYQRAFLQLCGTNTSSENSDNWTSSRYDFHDHQRALYALSGWTTSSRTISSTTSTSVAQTMQNSILNGDIMTAGGTGHAYSVVDVYQDSTGNWKVKLYNPWGVDATHQTMSFANGSRSNDGEIILDWSVFRANFTRVYTAVY